MKLWSRNSFLLLLSPLLMGFAASPKAVPTAADIEKAMRAGWDAKATASKPRTAYTANSIKIGTGAAANKQDRIDGIPPEAWVTIARVDFTVRTYYDRETQAVRRVRDCKVFQDQFGEWSVMINRALGQDETTSEPKK